MPRPTPRPTRPAPPAPRPAHHQPSHVNLLGYLSGSMVSIVVFRAGDPPFDWAAPEPRFPLYLIAR